MAKILSNEELFHFCEQFTIVLRSGIPAVEGLRVLWEESRMNEEKAFLEDLLHRMEETGDFSGTLEESGAFPASMISYLRLGEQTGSMDEVMQLLTEYYRQEMELSGQVRAAVTYPLLMLAMMAAVLAILLIRVLPVFSQVLAQIGVEMGGLSGSLLSLGRALRGSRLLSLVLLAILLLVVFYFGLTARGRAQLFPVLLKLPAFRSVPVTRDYGRLCQGISLGLHSGLPPEDCLEMAKDLTSVPEVRSRVENAAERLRQGERVSEAFAASGLFTGMEARFITVGFQSGSGDDVMERLSRRYTRESAAQIQQAVGVLEPTIVIVMTVLVGLVLLSVMLPLLGVLSEMTAV